MSAERPLLYIKGGCPWCVEAEQFLRAHGIACDVVDVWRDQAAMAKMIELSGQSRAPTLDWHGEVLADFGAIELEKFLRARKVI